MKPHLVRILLLWFVFLPQVLQAQTPNDVRLVAIMEALDHSDFHMISTTYSPYRYGGGTTESVSFEFNEFTNIAGRFDIIEGEVLLVASAYINTEDAVLSYFDYRNALTLDGEDELTYWLPVSYGHPNQVQFMFRHRFEGSQGNSELKEQLLFSFEELYQEYMKLDGFDEMYMGLNEWEVIVEALSVKMRCMSHFAEQILDRSDYPVGFPFGDWCTCQFQTRTSIEDVGLLAIYDAYAEGHDDLLKECLPLLPPAIADTIQSHSVSREAYNEGLADESMNVEMCTEMYSADLGIPRIKFLDYCTCRYSTLKSLAEEGLKVSDFLPSSEKSTELEDSCGHLWPNQ